VVLTLLKEILAGRLRKLTTVTQLMSGRAIEPNSTASQAHKGLPGGQRAMYHLLTGIHSFKQSLKKTFIY
jgi:hypothetical protein